MRAGVSFTSGFTLVEVLVALFVVALGIAGAAGLQTLALRSAREAARISDGTQLLASLAERMRANPVAMALPDADNPYLQLDYDAGTAPEAVATCHGDADCGPADLARFDLFEVAEAVAARFPGGHIRVCRDAAPTTSGSGLARWECEDQAGAPLVAKLGWHETGDDPGDEAAGPRLVMVVAGAAS